MISRRNFLKSTAIGAAAAGGALALPELGFLGEPTRAHAQGRGLIALNSNENAYGAAPAAMAAMREALGEAHRYPFGAYDRFFTELARHHNVTRKEIEGGCGSTELLLTAALAFTGPNRNLVMADPTFEAMGEFAKANRAQVIRVPLTADFRHDLAAMAAAITPETGLVFVCNPNNPTGSLTPRAELDAFLAKLPPQVTVLMDEAYHHFAASPDYVSYLERPAAHPRVFVTRTFSKLFGLAGLRVGYAVGKADVIAQMAEFRLPGSLNSIAVAGALAGLADPAQATMASRRNAADRDAFQREAEKRGVRYIPSQANFVMVDTKRPIQGVIEQFRRAGIEIGRPFPPLTTHARISLGTPREMEAFWRAWDAMK